MLISTFANVEMSIFHPTMFPRSLLHTPHTHTHARTHTTKTIKKQTTTNNNNNNNNRNYLVSSACTPSSGFVHTTVTSLPPSVPFLALTTKNAVARPSSVGSTFGAGAG